MKKTIMAVSVALAVASGAYAAGGDGSRADTAVRDYEEQIEKVAAEIDSIRRELETVTREMVEGETGRTIIFIKGKATDWNDRGIQVVLDGKTVFSRFLTPSELDAMSRGLPLELLEIRLQAGKHRVALSAMGQDKPKSMELTVKRAVINSWVAETDGGGIQWAAE